MIWNNTVPQSQDTTITLFPFHMYVSYENHLNLVTIKSTKFTTCSHRKLSV